MKSRGFYDIQERLHYLKTTGFFGGKRMSNKLIDFMHISKSYGMQTVLDDLNLYIRENEFLTLLGPSGCGKTTTLRILGGFESPDTGKVIFDGEDLSLIHI